jgi:hypothetical protein
VRSCLPVARRLATRPDAGEPFDRVLVDSGATYATAQVGADAVVARAAASS